MMRLVQENFLHQAELEVARTNKELLIASKHYAHENRLTSWWCFWSTLGLFVALIVMSSSDYFSITTNLSASVLAGFVLVRLFVIYHDFFHGAILKDSRLAYWILFIFGLVILSPAPSWKHSHDHHHKRNSSEFGLELGGFPILTTASYWQTSSWGRLCYRMTRSPFVILFGYITSFLMSKVVLRLFGEAKTDWVSLVSLVVHVALIASIGFWSLKALLLGMLLPLFIGCAFGTYLFYVQHNFPGMKRKQADAWDYVFAALHSSSFLKLSPMMNWFTGNIGFHHVHHLNSKIPFYRLPAAMNGLIELQAPTTVTLELSDIKKCLELKLWDEETEALVTFREAELLAVASDLRE